MPLATSEGPSSKGGNLCVEVLNFNNNTEYHNLIPNSDAVKSASEG